MDNLAEIFKETFDPYLNAPLHIWEGFAKQGEIIQTQKNEVIKEYGDREKYFYFILKGSGGIMLYQNNNYLCIDLCYDGDFFRDYLWFLTNQKTDLEVICFEPCTLFKISRHNFQELAKTEYGRLICQTASDSLFIQKQTQQLRAFAERANHRTYNINSSACVSQTEVLLYSAESDNTNTIASARMSITSWHSDWNRLWPRSPAWN